LLAFSLRGLYRLRVVGTWMRQVAVIIAATTGAFALFAAYEFVLQRTDFAIVQTRLLVALTWGSVIVVVSLTRLTLALLVGWQYRRGVGLTNLLVVGSGRLGKLTLQNVAASPDLGYRVVGFIHDLDGSPTDFGRFKALGTLADLERVIAAGHIAEVIVALPSQQHRQILRTVQLCERAGASFKLVPDLYELSLSRIDVDAVQGMPLIGFRHTPAAGWPRTVKRLIDITVAGALLVIAAPVWLLVALAIRLDSPGPVLYRQRRLGYRAQPFGMLKFRSMRPDAEQLLDRMRAAQSDRGVIFKHRSDPRRTLVGRFIRRTSLDELPQLINVLTGEMSLVGPRPPLPREYDDYQEWEKARLEVTPGLTGLWQVRGRSDIDFDEMVLMDLYYIENWSLRLDLQILLRTIPAVLSRRGAY
jgi:exopolysaccharide biosynthesis polyprenyl glycosylphosphotransferase